VNWVRRIAKAWHRRRRVRQVYALLIFLLWVWVIADRWSWWAILATVGGALAIGLLLTFLGRSMEFMDGVADSLGGLLGIGLFCLCAYFAGTKKSEAGK